MTRVLTKTQKKFIKELIEKDPFLKSADDIKIGDWEALEEMNNSEVLYQNVNRFISDYQINLVHC